MIKALVKLRNESDESFKLSQNIDGLHTRLTSRSYRSNLQLPDRTWNKMLYVRFLPLDPQNEDFISIYSSCAN